MMTCLLHSTRDSNSGLSRSLQQMSPEFKFMHACILLTVPLAYFLSMASWPAHNLLQELSALPFEFLPLLCCLTLEQLDISEFDEAPLGVKDLSIPFMSFQHSRSFSVPIISLSAALSEIVFPCEISAVPYADIISMLANPAVIQIYKRSLVILAGHTKRRTEDGGLVKHIVTLTELLEQRNIMNATAAQYCSRKYPAGLL